MIIVEIAKRENGSHRNQTGTFKTIPDGWAIIPDGMETKNFPFGELTAEEKDGVMTVTSWTAGEIPEQPPKYDAGQKDVSSPTPQEDINAMLIDHEYRLTLTELGVTE
jgi:hypothetical protein